MIEILQEERDYLFCVKPAGTESEQELPGLLKEQLACREIYCVHRLDRPVGGVMIFAKNGKAAARFSEIFAKGPAEKEYLALCEGCPTEQRGVWEDLLYHDKKSNKTFVVKSKRNGVKEARLSYELLHTQTSETGESQSLLKCQLHSGRSHQIRVQLASRKLPILGDRRYGSRFRMPSNAEAAETKEEIALWSYHLCLKDPQSGKPLNACCMPPHKGIWSALPETIDLAALEK